VRLYPTRQKVLGQVRHVLLWGGVREEGGRSEGGIIRNILLNL